MVLREILGEIAGERSEISTKKLGWYLRHFEGRVAAGLKLEKKPQSESSKNAKQYCITIA